MITNNNHRKYKYVIVCLDHSTDNEEKRINVHKEIQTYI